MRHVHYAPYDLSSLAAVNFILLCCHSVICVSESAICMLSFAFLCFSRYTTCITSSPQCEKLAGKVEYIGICRTPMGFVLESLGMEQQAAS